MSSIAQQDQQLGEKCKLLIKAKEDERKLFIKYLGLKEQFD